MSRKLSSYIKKYGPTVGPKLLNLLQSRSGKSNQTMQKVKRFKKRNGITP